MAKSKPKFRVGQVVCIKGMSDEPFEKIKSFYDDHIYHHGWVYDLDSGTFRQDELRPLTARERGSRAK